MTLHYLTKLVSQSQPTYEPRLIYSGSFWLPFVSLTRDTKTNAGRSTDRVPRQKTPCAEELIRGGKAT
jgi:hypothetical protein